MKTRTKFQEQLLVVQQERRVNEMFSLARALKENGTEIDDRQAKVLWNVVKTLEYKRKKGLL